MKKTRALSENNYLLENGKFKIEWEVTKQGANLIKRKPQSCNCGIFGMKVITRVVSWIHKADHFFYSTYQF